MRKIILQEWISLDGFGADSQGSTDFFNDERYNVGTDNDLLAFMDRIDIILLGANTYRMFAAYWPDADSEQEIVASKLNTIPKIVFSKTLKEAPWGKWQPATIISDDPVETIRQLKQKPGKNIVVWGSLKLSQTLINANLIDEYYLHIVPVMLGSGFPLFSSDTNHRKLQLVESKIYPAGINMLRYQPFSD
jgi:dihydrofolate reductase